MQETKHTFDFSVIMPIYQAEKYINEAIESLIGQTIGFERIQLILVDDGSTDGSGEICDRYKDRYPEQVTVIHKENGGVASARNAGMPYAEGKYVNFCDPDDRMALDVFEKVFCFMEKHPDVDICGIPVHLFGDRHGDHLLNYKFSKGTRVIDLSDDRNAQFVHFHVASSFIRTEVARAFPFEEHLSSGADCRMCQELLMGNPRLGVVADTQYYYRRHNNSVMEGEPYNKRAYTEKLHLQTEYMLNTAEERFGRIPKFVQYAVMYLLQWRVRNGFPNGVMTPEEAMEYKELVYQQIRKIDDDVILKQKNLSMVQKTFLLSRKKESRPELRVNKNGTDIEVRIGEKTMIKVSEMYSGAEFFSVDDEGNYILEGYHVIYYGIEKEELTPYILINGEACSCEKIQRNNVSYLLDDAVTWRMGFRAKIPTKPENLSICPAIKVGQTLVRRKIRTYGEFFPVSEEYAHMQAYCSDCMLKAKDGELLVSPKPSVLSRIRNEISLLREIRQKDIPEEEKKEALRGRLHYDLTKPFKRRKLWILSDRIMKADDNGEALFLYLLKNRPPRTRVVFAVSQNSPDARRLAGTGPCVDAVSLRHKQLHLLCDVNISSQADEVTVNPYYGHHEAVRDLLAHQRFVFLRHGVGKDDYSKWQNRYKRNMSGYVTSVYPEYRSVLEGDYSYSSDVVWLTGLPRHDRLYHGEEKKITVMPTWRRTMMERPDPRTGIWALGEKAKDNACYRFYTELLNSDRLLDALEKYGYQLQFFPHPNIRLGGITFEHDPRVSVLPEDTIYRDVFASSKLVVTDYSSAVFDFAWLRKPVLYCQFDRDEFFSGSHVYGKGYFDYERDGLGEVTYDLDSTIDRIIEYAANDCQLKDRYRDRIEHFFAFNDRENCRRVTEKILQL